MAIHPANPQILYLTRLIGASGTVVRGTFGAGGAAWVALTKLPTVASTPSGTSYIHAHQAPTNLYLFASDQVSSQMTIGDSPAAWTQFDDPHFIHLDPHAVSMTPNFRHHTEGGRGRIWQVNDGGVYFSTDGAKTWKLGRGFSTLSPINVAVSPLNGQPSAIVLGTGDNGGFFTGDGGKNWISADYQQGDNDAAFCDPKQPALMYVFAPGRGANPTPQIFLYTAPAGKRVDAGNGTTQRTAVTGPLNVGLPAPRQFG